MAQLAKLTPHRQAMLDINGHQLVARVFNADKNSVPLIYIHGIASSIDFWNAGHPEVVTSNYRYIALSLPGHYPATFPDGFSSTNLTAKSMMDVMSHAVRKLTHDVPAILVGHSTGGWMALCLAAYAPELVRGVVSVAGFAHGRWTGTFRARQMIAQWGPLGQWIFHVAGGYENRNFESFQRVIDKLVMDHAAIKQSEMLEATRDSIYASSRSGDMRALFAWFGRMPHIDISTDLPKIQAPVLQIHGDQDRIVPYSQGQLIAETAPNAELLTLPGCGHIIPWERESDYQAALTHWLSEHAV